MRYDADNLDTATLMAIVEATDESHEDAIRRDLRPHKTVINTPHQTTDAREGQFTLRVNFRAGRAIFRSDRGDPEHLIPEQFRELFSHQSEIRALH